ncbi:hypothetical protein SAMN05428996_1538 [Quadrisphaera sp. DSM 44207]|nr:hypothetical protein SAMN05428996_1538 [Quadrisphaera sp. DSM 44207]
MPGDAALVERYLASLIGGPDSTRRQRSWALRELLDHQELDAHGEDDPELPELPGLLPAPGPLAGTDQPQDTGQDTGQDIGQDTGQDIGQDIGHDAQGSQGAPRSGPGHEAWRRAGRRAERSVLDPDLVADWLASAGSGPRPASLPGLRARASAVRALAAYAEQHAGAAPGTLEALRPVLKLGTPIGPALADSPRVRQLLSLADPDALPSGVLPAVWSRFCAHVHLLALSGSREDVLAAVPVTAVAAGRLSIDVPEQSGSWALPSPAQRAVTAWLDARQTVLSSLRGGEPSALWVRVRPSTDHRTGALRPAGLPLSARGLRLAFTTTLVALDPRAPQLHGLSTHEVRSYARYRQL